LDGFAALNIMIRIHTRIDVQKQLKNVNSHGTPGLTSSSRTPGKRKGDSVNYPLIGGANRLTPLSM